MIDREKMAKINEYWGNCPATDIVQVRDIKNILDILASDTGKCEHVYESDCHGIEIIKDPLPETKTMRMADSLASIDELKRMNGIE